jgi:hypothetical protein
MGIPYPVRTQSDRPLVEEMTPAICTALTNKGSQCVPVIVARERPDAVRRKLVGSPGSRALLLVLDEWQSDTHTNTVLAYNATLYVLDEGGNTLTETYAEGRDMLGGSCFEMTGAAVLQACKHKLEELLNHSDVIAAFQ